MTEADFQATVIDYARRRGWRVAHFRKAQNQRGDWRTPVAADGKGFPDLVLVRDRVLFIELKTDVGRLTREQKLWRDALLRAGIGSHRAGSADYDVWRPRDWNRIVEELS